MNYDDIVEVCNQRLLFLTFYQEVKRARLMANSGWSQIIIDNLAQKYSGVFYDLESIVSGEKTFPECIGLLLCARVHLLVPRIKNIATIFFAIGLTLGLIGVYLLWQSPFFFEFSPGLALVVVSVICCLGTVWSFYQSIKHLHIEVSDEMRMAEELQEIYFPRFHD